MTVARVRRPICEARPAAETASPRTYTPPWKYRTTWRGSIPSIVISAVGTPPSAAAVTVTPAGSGWAEVSSRSSRRSSLTSRSAGKADCRRIASRFSRCSVLTEGLLRSKGRVGGREFERGNDADSGRLAGVLPPAAAAAVMHQHQRSARRALEGPADPALIRSEFRDGRGVPVAHIALRP